MRVGSAQKSGRSLRSVLPEQAAKITATIEPGLKSVGVFVNESADNINAITNQCKLDFVQLHGDEAPELAERVDAKVIRAIRVANFETASNEITVWQHAGAIAVLLDAASGRQFGGTGKQLDWQKVTQLTSEIPIVLAGGLNCDNVAQAISVARPAAVDVASGVEKFPGAKDHDQMAAFIASAKQAFDR